MPAGALQAAQTKKSAQTAHSKAAEASAQTEDPDFVDETDEFFSEMNLRSVFYDEEYEETSGFPYAVKKYWGVIDPPQTNRLGKILGRSREIRKDKTWVDDFTRGVHFSPTAAVVAAEHRYGQSKCKYVLNVGV
ncbi:hypothetical protein R3P38DRAFT_2758872 [Favolaschia claudopus]|uniref:Uncharacterized protein n=1 Tax=Favolaschia claudopus TaxID=2862362 RepID=A0AAW0E675_9AGAR